MSPMAWVLVFLAVLCGAEGLSLLIRSRRRGSADRVRTRLRTLAPVAAGSSDAPDSVVRRQGGGGRLARLVAPLPSMASLERLLRRAGMPTTPVRCCLLTLGFGALGWAAGAVLADDTARGAPGLAAALLPWLSLRRTARRRMRRFEEQLPEALELLTRALRAGHGLGSGFQLVGQELEDPVGTEFGLVAEEIRFGLDLRDALANLMRRVDNDDLPYLATAVLIQRQTGGNLAELLDKLATLLRERGQFAGRVRALTAQGRGAAAFLALWLPLITGVVYLVAPGYLTPLFEHTWGHAVLAAAVAADVAGYLIARRIADVQA